MLSRLSQQVSTYKNARHWYIAYSGGLDSHVLLHALAHLKQDHPEWPDITAVHINHQLQNDANHWEQHCQQQALALGVSYLAFKVDIPTNTNVEAIARQERYKAFASLLLDSDCLFMAHHQQDQLETFIYRLFRGAGIQGLMAMPKERMLNKGNIVRPLLDASRKELESYAELHRLLYVNDPSNADITFDRNYIRHRILPVIQQRWPAFAQVLSRTVLHLNEANELLLEVAKNDIFLLIESDASIINYEVLLTWSVARRNNLLRYWLKLNGIVLTSEQLNAIWCDVVLAKVDASPCFFINHQLTLRRYSKKLYIVNSVRLEDVDKEWNGMEACLITSYGLLQLSTPQPLILTVRSRRGGEVIQPIACAFHKTIKQLLQEHAIPPWERQHIPLIYYGEQLIALADKVISQEGSAILNGATIEKVTYPHQNDDLSAIV